jgi:hypothetical protein
MKYQWTDWITHVPGQEMPAGTYGLWEFHGRRNGKLKIYATEGLITAAQNGHGCWYATVPGKGGYCVLTRYKLRSIAQEIEAEATREAELVR